MKKLILIAALLLPMVAFAQGMGIEDRVDVIEGEQVVQDDRLDIIEGEQTVQNDRIDDLENSPGPERAVPDINELNSIQSNLLNHHFDLRAVGNDLYSCGQYQIFGCDTAHSSIESFGDLIYESRTNSIRFSDDEVTGGFVYAIPTVRRFKFDNLRFVSHANITSFKSLGQTLVDDCDNPTVALIDRNRNPRFTRIPITIMDNAGRVYERGSADLVTFVDVTGSTFGVLNFIVHRDTTTPICTPGVSDRTGIWEQHPYSFVLDTNDARFVGPYTYTGTSIGLIDRVEALENP